MSMNQGQILSLRLITYQLIIIICGNTDIFNKYCISLTDVFILSVTHYLMNNFSFVYILGFILYIFSLFPV
jgi:hypothetical protein